MDPNGVLASVDARTLRFQKRFIVSVAIVMGVVAAGAAIVTALTQPMLTSLLAAGASTALSVVVAVLASRGRPDNAGALLAYGVTANLAAALLTSPLASAPEGGLSVIAPFLFLVGYLKGRRHCALFGAYGLAVIVSTYVHHWLVGLPLAQALNNGIIFVLIYSLGWVIVWLFSGNIAESSRMMRGRLADIDNVVAQARRVAGGDLAGTVAGGSEVSEVVRAMLASLRALVQRIQETVGRLGSASNEIAAMMRQQNQGVVVQSSAIAETRESLRSVLRSSSEIASSAAAVLRNAETTQQNNEQVTERIRALSTHTVRIGEILDGVRDIANKAEILALNAALEGTKAGEVGRGFSLVAGQMQALAESVKESVRAVRALTGDIREATQAAVLSTDEATKLAAATTDAARQITLVTQQQRSSTEQVGRAMEDIAQISAQTASGSEQTTTAVQDLAQLAEQLGQAVHQFNLQEPGGAGR